MNSFTIHIFILILYSTESLSQPSSSSLPTFRNDIPFNIDLDFAVGINNPTNKLFNPRRSPDYAGTMFGASLAADNDIIFIGAPKMVSRHNANLVTGAAFRCSSDFARVDNVTCKEVDFVSSIISGRREYVERNHSMVGYSMTTLGRNVMICAPTWVVNSHRSINDPDPSSEGMCFNLRIRQSRASPELVYFPTIERIKSQRPYESHAMFGFSIINDDRTNNYIVGIPGFSDFAGAIAVESNSVAYRSNSFSRPDSYAGYALALISSSNSNRYLAIGIPRTEKFTGRVMFVDIDENYNRVLDSIASPMDGSGDYFGSVLTTNVNRGRNLQDLFVGAPLHSTKGRRQSGRVYVYKDILEKLSSRNLGNPIVIHPKIRKPLAQFGSAIAVIDMNRDGFNDIVIAAPYEETSDPDSLGALYFYHYEGYSLNVNSEIRIEPKDFGYKLRGFGFSIWTGSDFDKNGFNDLLIGSALSEEVTILRTKPVIKLTTTMEFDRKGINLTDNLKCSGDNACFRVKYCILADARANFKQDVTYVVNFTVSDRRLRVKETRVIAPKQSVILHDRQRKTCSDNPFYVEMKKQESIYDIITPIEVELRVAVADQKTPRFCSHCPVAHAVVSHKEINFEHGCAGKKCVSRLNLDASLRYGPENVMKSIVQGIYSNLELGIFVKNTGEASIDTSVIIELNTPGLSLRNEENRCSSTKEPTIFKCDVNRFLLNNQKEDFKILFDFERIQTPKIVFNLRLESRSEISKDSIIHMAKQISVIKEADFKLIGDAQYNFSFSTQSPDVSFPISVLVDKTGPSRVNSSVVSFLLPYDIVDIDPISKYRCYQIDSLSTSISEKMLFNGTLTLPCETQPEVCRRFECTVGAFKPGSQTQNLDISLIFQSTEIPTKIAFQRAFFSIEFQFYTHDPLIENKKSFASFRSEILFEKQATAPNPKTDPLIMIGGGSVGLVIILVTVYVLFKAGFFKRKKREEMMKAKARMSMAPAAFDNLANRNGS